MAISQSNLPQFIAKLYAILSDPRYHNYIQWGYDGLSFVIIDPAEFSSSVLSEHFKHNNLNSFVRQLNKYDFHKVKSEEMSKKKYGPGMWEFAHKNFRRDRLDLIARISRKPNAHERGAAQNGDGYNADGNGYHNSMFYNYVTSTMSSITKYFELISADLKLIRRSLGGQGNADSRHVLVAEDNAACAKYASSIFKRNHFIAVSAESVNELHYLLANTKFEMILISAGIPDIVDILANIRAKSPAVPIVLTVDKGEAETFQSIGADKILVKPYLYEELVSIIKQRHASNVYPTKICPAAPTKSNY